MKFHELYPKMAILCGEVLNINSYTGVFFLGLKVKKKGGADFSVLSRIAGRLQAESTTCLNLTPQAKACVFGNSQKPFAYKLYEFQTCVNSQQITDDSIIYVLRNNS